MRRKLFLFFTVLVALLSFVGCSKNEVDDVLSKNFKIDETTKELNFGESYTIEPVSIKDAEGLWHDAVIEIKDADGAVKTIEAGEYKPAKLGDYKVTYKVYYGNKNKQCLEKSFVITVKDLSAPEITGITSDSLVLIGAEVDLSNVVAKDNLDGDVTPVIKVTFDNTDVTLTNGKFTASEKGCYVVNVKATDKAGNSIDKNINVFTTMDYEQGIAQTSEFYPIEISTKYSYKGNTSAKIHWFDTNVNWLNDACLLGSDTALLSNAKYLSFWVYFDGESTGLNKLLVQTKYTYFDTYIFEEYGKQMDYYWNFILRDDAPQELKDLYASSEGKFAYELETNKWYRIVIDLTRLTNASKYGQTANGFAIDGPLEAKANPKTLGDLIFGFGTWDSAIGNSPTKVVDTYIDEIKLTNDLNNETYNEEVKVNITSEESIVAKINDEIEIVYNVTPVGSGDVKFTSTDETVAIVDETGKVTCVGEGQAAIILTSVTDPRKSNKVNITVIAAGQKVRDELNKEEVTGNKSLGDWETEGKYNMIEHIGWASNEFENGVCGHSDLFSMTIAHGTVANYATLGKPDANGTTLVAKDDDGVTDATLSERVKIIDGWQAMIYGKDGLLFVFTAKKDIAIKSTGDTQENRIGGWVSDTLWQWVKVDAEGNATVLHEFQNPEFANIESDWFEIKAGETFILLVRANGDEDYRNFELLPFFQICPMIEEGNIVRDELNKEEVTGNKSLGDWETEGKYNMIEHIGWASNEFENGVCGHSDLFSMTIAHGTVANYATLGKPDANGTTLVAKDDDGVTDATLSERVKIIDGWQAMIYGKDGLLFVFTAKKDIAIKSTGDTQENRIGGWVSDTLWQWVKVDAEGNATVLHEFQNPEFANIESDWFEIKAGETFILLVRANGDEDYRNFELLPFFQICPMIQG